MKVRWTVPAANQLHGIFDYIAASNPLAAERIVRRISNAIQQTGRMPNAGRIGRVDGTREAVVPGTNYLVVYRTQENMIQVLAVLHGARNWPQEF